MLLILPGGGRVAHHHSCYTHALGREGIGTPGGPPPTRGLHSRSYLPLIEVVRFKPLDLEHPFRVTPATLVPETIALYVLFRLVKRGGRNKMHFPDASARRQIDNTLVKALARAFRWKRILKSGEFATIAEPADREEIAPSHMTRVLRLTLLAPEIVETIHDWRQGPAATLARLLEPFPVDWDDGSEQRRPTY